ncbi:MAG: oligosaccharide flippase family protein [Oscillospiraceae bacterium]
MADKARSSYQKLFSNTLIFTLGSFSSKLLVLFLVPIYTNILTEGELGMTDFIVQCANWLVPVVTLTISDAIIRFGLDRAYEPEKVFSIGNAVCLTGLLAAGAFVPLAAGSDTVRHYIGDYTLLLYVYVITSSVKLLYSNFVRALEKVKLFAFNGLLTTFLTLGFTVLFLPVLRMGITGYLLAILLSDFISVIFLLFAAKLWRYIRLPRVDVSLGRAMLRYAMPLIPTQLLWLLINLANSLLTIHFLGTEENGILAAAYKIPNIVASVYIVFGQAWNMSAITENDSDDRERFYTNVFASNQSIMYVLAAGILLLVKPVTSVWIGAQFQEAVLYAPVLIFSTIFMCFTTFLGTVYVATKRTRRSFVTSLAAAAICIVFSWLLIPVWGLYAAALSNAAAFVTVFIIRLIDARKLIRFDVSVRDVLLNAAILAAMTGFNYLHGVLSAGLLLAGFAAVTALNIRFLAKILRMLLPARLRARIPFLRQ